MAGILWQRIGPGFNMLLSKRAGRRTIPHDVAPENVLDSRAILRKYIGFWLLSPEMGSLPCWLARNTDRSSYVEVCCVIFINGNHVSFVQLFAGSCRQNWIGHSQGLEWFLAVLNWYALIPPIVLFSDFKALKIMDP